MNRVALYHKDCADGTAAAAVFLTKYPEAHVVAMHHKYVPEQLEDAVKHVTSDTECFTLDCIIGAGIMAERGASLTIIDHHEAVFAAAAAHAHNARSGTAFLDKDHSAAVLAWKFFYPDIPVPHILELIEDIDLWRFKYGKDADYLRSAVEQYENDPLGFTALLHAPLEPLLEKGRHAVEYRDMLIDQYMHKANPVELSVTVSGVDMKVPCYNATFFKDYIANRFSEKTEGVVGVFAVVGADIRISFRSFDTHVPNAFAVAAAFGGGGHPNASACSLPLADFVRLTQ
jgi:uncharacterized protein